MDRDLDTLGRSEIEIPFLPIACSIPLRYAQHLGLFEQHGLKVTLRSTPTWNGINALLVYGKVEVAHVLTPVPLALKLGLDGKPADLRLLTTCNVNGQVLLLAQKHRGLRSVLEMKGFKLGIPHRFAIHHYLLADYLAKHGLDPLSDVTLVEVAPHRIPHYLEHGRLDGAMSPDPPAQIAVQRGAAFIHQLSRDLMPGHPCCGLAVTQHFYEQHPRTAEALTAAMIEAERRLHAADALERQKIAQTIVGFEGWTPEASAVLEPVITGTFADGLGQTRTVPDRLDFVPQPWREYGVWLLTQMQRWGQLPATVDYRAITDAVFATDATCALAERMGFSHPAPDLSALGPSHSEDAFERMLAQPFCAFTTTAPQLMRDDLSASARARIGEILERLAEVVGGRYELTIERTADGELGWLEQLLHETIRDLRFARESLSEQLDLERRARKQATVIAAQEELIRELMAPIIPVLEGALLLPLMGQLDLQRLQRIMESVLGAVTELKARVILIDVTGVPAMDAGSVKQLLKLISATALLGAECVLVGVPKHVATALVGLNEDLASVHTLRNLQSGIEYASRRLRPRQS